MIKDLWYVPKVFFVSVLLYSEFVILISTKET